MIVRLQRSATGDGPWMLNDRTGLVVDFLDATPELEAMMEGAVGFFDAARTDTGWDVRSRVADAGWGQLV